MKEAKVHRRNKTIRWRLQCEKNNPGYMYDMGPPTAQDMVWSVGQHRTNYTIFIPLSQTRTAVLIVNYERKEKVEFGQKYGIKHPYLRLDFKHVSVRFKWAPSVYRLLELAFRKRNRFNNKKFKQIKRVKWDSYNNN